MSNVEPNGEPAEATFEDIERAERQPLNQSNAAPQATSAPFLNSSTELRLT